MISRTHRRRRRSEEAIMNVAISYKRFSSLRQAKGDSDRRQSDLAQEYCRRHDLKLIDSYLDAGLSGFTGENLSDDSALRALLHSAKSGRFAPGTRLIVESLDRLSRREITAAVRLFLDILDTGLVIVTLIDGEQVFTKDRVDTDLTALIIATSTCRGRTTSQEIAANELCKLNI